MATGRLLGRVIVIAGETPLLADAAAAATEAAAQVAVVSRSLDETTVAAVRFRANPGDPDVWDRIAMHVEQHLGPVDAVVTDADAHATTQAVFAADLARRGHGAVVVLRPGDDVASLVTHLCDTPRATRPRPGDATPGQ